MANEDETLTLRGTVIETLPNAQFKVKLENDAVVLAHVSGKIRQNNIRILLNDEVDVELSVYDMTRARLTFRYKK
jgi:translation initiation factor IF-1